jgi:SAM-dependent methyltransferase
MVYYRPMTSVELHKAPNLDANHFPLFLERMSQGAKEKYDDISPVLHPVFEQFEHPFVVSVGAGSGMLEACIAKSVPQAHVFPLDYSRKMTEAIWEMVNSEDRYSGYMDVLDGRAERLPYADASVHIVIASSMVHHPASFQDNFSLGASSRAFFHEAYRILVPGGRLVIRDFMQSDHPEREVMMRIGLKQTSHELMPSDFLERFIAEYKGMDVTDMKTQIAERGRPIHGSSFRVPLSLASEIAAHYSWAFPRFAEEVKERYTYAPIDGYAGIVLGSFEGNGQIVRASTRILPGYPEHVDKRFDFFTLDGYRIPVPIYTGVIGIQKR